MIEGLTEESILQLKNYIEQAEVITFYGGAGTSTESGIPDYRSRFGIWTAMEESGQSPVKIAHPRNIRKNPEKFFKNREEGQRTKPEPNIVHQTLAAMEKKGKDIRVITQNVDGLHQKAGHRYVLELHGNHRVWHCMDCGREYLVSELKRDDKNVPRCYVDQGIVRPNVVYFGENADKTTVEKAKRTLKQSDLLLIVGTSLTTPLAKRLIHHFEGDSIVGINLDEIEIAPLEWDLFIQAQAGEVFKHLDGLF